MNSREAQHLGHVAKTDTHWALGASAPRHSPVLAGFGLLPGT